MCRAGSWQESSLSRGNRVSVALESSRRPVEMRFSELATQMEEGACWRFPGEGPLMQSQGRQEVQPAAALSSFLAQKAELLEQMRKSHSHPSPGF